MSKFHIPESTIYVCLGSKCAKRGAKEYYKEMKGYLKKAGLSEEVELIKTECTDRCKFAPVLSAQPANVWLKEYTPKDLRELFLNVLKIKEQ